MFPLPSISILPILTLNFHSFYTFKPIRNTKSKRFVTNLYYFDNFYTLFIIFKIKDSFYNCFIIKWLQKKSEEIRCPIQ